MTTSERRPRTRLAEPIPLLAVLLGLTLFAAACVGGTDIGSETGAGDESGETDEGAGAAEADGADGVAATDGETDDDDGGPDDGSTGELPVGAVADPASLASIEESPCAFDEPIPLPIRPVCHTVSVPENWDDPDPDDRVILQVAVFEGDDPTADPGIYFDGGPGGHTLDLLSFNFQPLVNPFLDRGDYLVFDQRGVGLSEPSLACPEVTEASLEAIAANPDTEAEAETALDAYVGCRDRLMGGGADLEAYHSIASANDVEAIRALLGYDRFNVVGISYGTRLAQTYMRLYPESIRAVVLDSVFPTEADLWTNLRPGAQRAFEQLFEGCAASPACSETYPDFEDDYFELVAALDAEPIDLELDDLLGGPGVPARYDGTDLVGLTFSALYDQRLFATIPQLVDDGLKGDYSLFRNLGALQTTNLRFISSGLQVSVECHEEIAFESADARAANRATDPRFEPLDRLDGGLTLFDICQEWPAGEAPDVESVRVESDIPTLLIGGQYDPITPPAGMDVIAAGLTTSHSFLFPHDGHGLVPTDCGAEIALAFLENPEQSPDGSCIAGTTEPAWAPAAFPETIEFEPFESTGIVAISGVRPSGWDNQGNGAFARQRTVADPTALVIQPTGGLPAAGLINLLGGQLGAELTAGSPIQVADTTWSQYSGSIDDETAVRVAIDEDAGVVILLVAEPGEIDGLFDEVFGPVASAATPG